MPTYSSAGMLIRSRRTGTSMTSPAFQVAPSRSFCTRKTTVVPGLPRIFSLASELVIPCVDTPSIASISSPQTSPYRTAGESAYGSLMITLPSLSGL